MGFFKTDIEKMEVMAARQPFNPTAAIPKSTVQEAIEAGFAGQAPSDADYLVKTASANLSAERVVTDTTTIAVDWATAGQAKFAVVDTSITYAKMQDVAGLSVMGRSANTSGVAADITGTDGQVLRVSGTALGFGTVVAAGIASDAVITAKILDANVTYAKLQNVAALSVVGRSANSSGVSAAITASTDQVLRESSGTLGFGTVVAGGIASDAVTTAKILNSNVTLAKIANGTALSVLGVTGNAGAAYADMVAGSDGHVMRRSGTAIGFGTIAAAGITDGVITFAKLASAAFSTDGTLSGNSDTVLPTQKAVKTYVDALATLVSGALIFKGDWDASSGAFPGTAGRKTGWFYKVSVAGTMDGVTFTVGDDLYAVVDTASTSTYAANWLQISGSFTSAEIISTLASASITYAKIQNVGALSVFGRSANSSGVGADITGTDGQVLRVSGTTLGFGTIVAGGIASDAVTTAKILDANVTYAKIQSAAAGLSVVGRSANTSGVNADIAGTDGQVLRVSGTALGFGTVAAAGIASDAVTTVKILDANVTYAKIANAAAGLSVIGRSANSSGVNADIAAANDKEVLRRSGTAIGFGAVDATSSAALTGVLQAACAPVLSGAVINAGGTGTTTMTGAIEIVIGNGTDTITTGVKGFIYCPFAFTITEWTLVGDASGSIVVDIWSDVYANGRPTGSDSITASAKPTISGANTGQSSTLTGWTSSGAIPAGNFLGFNVDSITTCKQVTLTLKITKTG